jgi:uncharacterized protein (DUF608 family)
MIVENYKSSLMYVFVYKKQCHNIIPELTISHLQFADDTIIIGKRSWSNISYTIALLQVLPLGKNEGI